MKIIITKGQVDLIKEKTNKSLNLIMKYYDIEDNGSTYRGDSKIQTFVTFYPKDYDNEMTREAATSTCNWKINEDNEPVFIFMTIPHSRDIPLMDYIGDTEDLEEYLEGIHKKEVDVFVKRINHRRNNPLNESVSKKKKLFIKILGQDLIDSIRIITSPKQLPKEFSKSLGSSRIKAYIDAYGPLYYFVFEGEPFIYKDRVSPKGEEYEMFVDAKGESFFDNQISDRLGLSDTGLKFYDVINTIFNEGEPLNESVDKNKKFLIKVMGQDFTGKIKEVKDPYDVPMGFDELIGPDYIKRVLNYFGPMHLVDIDGKKYLYQYRIDEEDGDYEWFHGEDGFNYVDGEILEKLGLDELGLRFKDIIDMFINEGESLNENVDKNKKFLINVMGEDLTGKIKEIKDGSDIPKRFHRYLELGNVKQQIDMVGPMYLVKIRGNYYLYQDQSHFYQSHNDASFGEQFMSEDGKWDRSGKILEELGLDVLGLKFSDIINIFYNEGEPLNEEYDMSGKPKENTKIKNLLKNVLENKEFEYSFTDRTEGVWDGYDYENIEQEYTFEYRVVVNNVLGVGSDSVADISVIIDDILLDGESVYDGWVEIGYNEDVWYIEHLHDYLDDDVFDLFPFSIYPTYYGHDEEI